MYITILEIRKYWEIMSFQYCKIPSIAQYRARKKIHVFWYCTNIGIDIMLHTITILVLRYCTNSTGTEKCSSIGNNTGIPAS